VGGVGGSRFSFNYIVVIADGHTSLG
jgi:hypothetical protein